MYHSKKIRADELLFLQGKVESRSRAKILIIAGKVRSGPDSVVQKPSQMLSQDTNLIVESPPRFVSRGGEKLDGALKYFSINLSGKTVLDVGASTGGFTDCALQNGADSVTCVDVGRGQLHFKLLSDPRVANFEKINARELDLVDLPFSEYDFVVGDLSFISLKKVLPVVWHRVKRGGALIMLIKPQFEATREEVSRGRGIIRDIAIQQRVVGEIVEFCNKNLNAFELQGICESPILGGDGNKEFLFYARRI